MIRNPTESNTRGSRDVAIQDQFTEVIDLHLTRLLDTVTLLAAVVINTRTASIETTGVVPAIGDILCLKDVDGVAFFQGEVLTVTPIAGDQYTVTVDTPFDFAFSIVDGCSIRSDDMAVNGSVSPVTFSIGPGGLKSGTEWDIIRTTGVINGTSAMDDGLFGDLPALTNGLVLRSVNGVTKNLFNAKTNGDLSLHCGGDRTYADRAPAGETSISFRRTFNGADKNGVTLRLCTDSLDTFSVIIQDDLSGTVSFQMVAQGHIVE